MAVQLIVSCPFCGKEDVGAQAVVAWPAGKDEFGRKPEGADTEAAAICGHCSSAMIAYLRCGGDPKVFNPFREKAAAYNSLHSLHGTGCELLGVRPEPPRPDVPAHLPPRVERAMLDGELAFLRRDWNGAAAHYRKAVDRAVTVILSQMEPPIDPERKMLGQKIALLENTGLLPAPMLDWIRIVKDQGNFALHEDDRDFENAGEIEPARRFARLLLEYLFTLPKEIELSREGTSQED